MPAFELMRVTSEDDPERGRAMQAEPVSEVTADSFSLAWAEVARRNLTRAAGAGYMVGYNGCRHFLRRVTAAC